HRSDRNRVDRFKVQATQRKQIARQHSPLIDSPLARRGQTPVSDQPVAVKDSQRRVAVADVNCQKHKRTVTSNQLQVTSEDSDLEVCTFARHLSLVTYHS